EEAQHADYYTGSMKWRASKSCAHAASAWTCGTSRLLDFGERPPVSVCGFRVVVPLVSGERILVREQRLEAHDVTLLVGGHLGGEGAHGVGARVGRDVVVEGLRAPLEAQRDGERLGRVARRSAGADALAAEIPAELPAGELGEFAPRGAQRDDLVLLALLAP